MGDVGDWIELLSTADHFQRFFNQDVCAFAAGGEFQVQRQMNRPGKRMVRGDPAKLLDERLRRQVRIIVGFEENELDIVDLVGEITDVGAL